MVMENDRTAHSRAARSRSAQLMRQTLFHLRASIYGGCEGPALPGIQATTCVRLVEKRTVLRQIRPAAHQARVACN